MNNNQIINKIVMVMKVVTVFVELARATMVCDCEYFVFDITPIVIRILLTPVLGFKQTLTPSPHVCSNFALPGGPHSPCQDPPLPQQLNWPLLLTPHLRHAGQKIMFTHYKITWVTFRMAPAPFFVRRQSPTTHIHAWHQKIEYTNFLMLSGTSLHGSTMCCVTYYAF